MNDVIETLKFKKLYNEKILSVYSIEQIESELVDFALDCFIESLKNENPRITEKEIKEKVKEIIKWKRSLLKN